MAAVHLFGEISYERHQLSGGPQVLRLPLVYRGLQCHRHLPAQRLPWHADGCTTAMTPGLHPLRHPPRWGVGNKVGGVACNLQQLQLVFLQLQTCVKEHTTYCRGEV